MAEVKPKMRLSIDMRESNPFIRMTPAIAIVKASQCRQLEDSFMITPANKIVKIGDRY